MAKSKKNAETKTAAETTDRTEAFDLPDLDVQFGSVTRQKTCRKIGLAVDRDAISLDDLSERVTKARLSVLLVFDPHLSRDAAGQLIASDGEGSIAGIRIAGIADCNGLGASNDERISLGLTFALDGVDRNDLDDIAHRRGYLSLTRIGSSSGEDAADESEAGDGDDSEPQGRWDPGDEASDGVTAPLAFTDGESADGETAKRGGRRSRGS